VTNGGHVEGRNQAGVKWKSDLRARRYGEMLNKSMQDIFTTTTSDITGLGGFSEDFQTRAETSKAIQFPRTGPSPNRTLVDAGLRPASRSARLLRYSLTKDIPAMDRHSGSYVLEILRSTAAGLSTWRADYHPRIKLRKSPPDLVGARLPARGPSV
jgi:hypothetical protein